VPARAAKVDCAAVVEGRAAFRVVPQLEIERSDEQVLIPGDRYLLVGSSVVVDRSSQKIAHRFKGRVLRVAGENSIAVGAADAVAVVDLVSGARVCEAQLDEPLNTRGCIPGGRGAFPQDAMLSSSGTELYVIREVGPRATAPHATEVSVHDCSTARRVATGYVEPYSPARFATERARGGEVILMSKSGCPDCVSPSPRKHLIAQLVFGEGSSPERAIWKRLPNAPSGPEAGRDWGRPEPGSGIERLDLTPGIDGATASPEGGERFVTQAAGNLAWSLREARATSLFAPEDPSLEWRARRFIDARTVFLVGTAGGDGAASAPRAVVAVWDVITDQVQEQDHGLVDLHAPVELSPAGDRYLLLRPRVWPPARNPLEVWRVGASAADWTHAGCGSIVYWSSDGERILCGLPSADPFEAVLSSATGQPATPTLEDAQRDDVPSDPADLGDGALPCGAWMRLCQGTLELLSRRGDLVATFLHLAAGAWAVTTPDGFWTGSDSARGHLAWFRADGTLLDDAEAECLRRPDHVSQAIEQALTSCEPAADDETR
jgi:hypothetical protein